MLEGIRSINWIDLGNPSIPDWIEGLGSKSETTRKKSYDAIYDTNMDSLGKFSPYIVPFLIELLENDIDEKDSVLLLLTQISDSAISVLKRNYKTANLANETMKAVERGTDIFLALLANKELLSWDLELLSNLKSQSVYIIPYLLELREKPEINDDLKSTIDRTIASLSG